MRTNKLDPAVLRAFPDDLQFAPMDPEVVGQYLPVRKHAMRVPDIPEHEWNRLSSAQKKIQIEIYPIRCETRRKDKLKRVRDAMQARLTTPSFVHTTGQEQDYLV